jgi:hypothetical protein
MAPPEEGSATIAKVHHFSVVTRSQPDGSGVERPAQPIHREGDAELKPEAADSLPAPLAC